MKTTNTTKKTTAIAVKIEPMNYNQVRALAGALWRAKRTKKQIAESIEKFSPKGGMDASKKKAWLKDHGDEEASYRQCMMLAMCHFKAHTPKVVVQDTIDQIDKVNGYKPAKKTASKKEAVSKGKGKKKTARA